MPLIGKLQEGTLPAGNRASPRSLRLERADHIYPLVVERAVDHTRSMTHRILIVEDSDDVRDSYVRWFEKEGFEVTQARDGEQAWSLSRRHRPDVVLLDVELPGMDGYTLAGKWRADPNMARVPVVVLSGRRGDE